MLGSLFGNFMPTGGFAGDVVVIKLVFFTLFLILVEIRTYQENDLDYILKAGTWVKLVFFYYCFLSLFFFGATAERQFIYAQF
jgi:hypothetical protein